ncbi:sporulation protein [Streptomyces sp. NPDC014894]|uniref:sporulation protein n=1 Tax=Streptomyces sp. NPDC014894 TaxID=3364931 RepID=UPI0037003663
MVFKRLLGTLGVGGPAVDTELDPGVPAPGSDLTGQVRLTGGNADRTITRLTLELVARVEIEGGDEESEGLIALERFTVAEDFGLAAGERLDVPFAVPLPWETPITALHGQSLGVVLAVRTELEIAGAKDKGDLDPLAVGPLPAQEAVLEALGQLGFGFASADLEYGRIGGTGQLLPFYQEIELTPPPRHQDAMRQLEVTFLAHPGGMEVVLEADSPGGLFTSGHEALTLFRVSHTGVEERDWNAEVDGWVRQLAATLGTRTAPAAYAHHGSHGDHSHHGHHGHHSDGGHSRSGPGVGTAVAVGAAGLAVGVAGGLVAAEAVDEVGDFFEEEEEG